MSAPKVFISYSHDSQQHKDWVLRLANELRTNGIDAKLDQWDLSPGQDIAPSWLEAYGLRIVCYSSAPARTCPKLKPEPVEWAMSG